MMEPVLRVDDSGANPVEGVVKYDVPKLLWNLGMIVLAIIFAPITFSIEAFALFLVLTYFSLLVGHSAGMHRLMIHRTYECHSAVEKTLIYVGVLVGMSGPFGIIKIHDVRDWAQRKERCHEFFSHDRGFLNDIWWQLTCRFEFKNPPCIKIEEKYSSDRFYKFLESTWRYHQLLLAIVLYSLGGWSFVVWGVFVRVAVSVAGHWTITYFCHNPGPGIWRVKNAAVQASNIPGLGVITYGECWHNNHHAFPESARIGLEDGQSDPTWRFIELLAFMGFATNIRKPRTQELRSDLHKIT